MPITRKVLINEKVYEYHRVASISHQLDGQTVIVVESWESEEAVSNPAKSPFSAGFPTEQDIGMTFAEAEQRVFALPDFDEYTEPAQAALDAVLPILTDEQAEQVPDAFPLWSAAGKAYKVGDRVRYDGVLYKCVQAHTSQEGWEPPNAASLWSRIGEPAEYPEWIQPTGAHDAYAKGDKVSHNEKHWSSDIDANTYEPGVYGWTEE